MLIRFDVVKSDRKDLEDIKASVGDYGSRCLFRRVVSNIICFLDPSPGPGSNRVNCAQVLKGLMLTNYPRVCNRHLNALQREMDVQFELRQRITRYLTREAFGLESQTWDLVFFHSSNVQVAEDLEGYQSQASEAISQARLFEL